MKVFAHYTAQDTDNGLEGYVHATEAECLDHFWDMAWDAESETVYPTLAEFKTAFADDLTDAMEKNCPDVAWIYGQETIDVTPLVPSDPVAAVRAAVEALAYARDCLKAAGADRAADKVRLALSSAKGAVRHAEGKAMRTEMEGRANG